MDFGGIVPLILVQCLVPAELSAYLPVSYLLILFLVATQERHHCIYVASHIVGYNTPESDQVNWILHPPEDSSLYTKYLGAREQDFWIILINYHILQYLYIVSHLGDHNLLLLH